MPAVRKPTIQPHRWQLSGWVLGAPGFTHQAHLLMQSKLEQVARRPSAHREANGEVVAMPPLQPAEFLELEGVGIEISRSPAGSQWSHKQLSALDESLKAMPGWEPGFAVVLAGWVSFPLYVNNMEVSPQAYIFTPDVEHPSDFRISDLNFADAFRDAIREHAGESVRARTPSGLSGSAEGMALAVLLEKVRDYARRSPIWPLARERALAASLPAVKERSGPKPRF